jgi:hypothetical protein
LVPEQLPAILSLYETQNHKETQSNLQRSVQPRSTSSGRSIIKILWIASLFLGITLNSASAAQPSLKQETRPPAKNPNTGIWISPNELSALPTSGPAWQQLKEFADLPANQPDLSDQDSETNVIVLAKALVYARTGQTRYRDEVVAALKVITFNNTEDGPEVRTLSVGRELVAYVIAADLIDLPNYNPTFDAQFKSKLRQLLTKKLPSWTGANKSLQQTHEERPNNWGTHAGASRAAIAVYLGDKAELERTARVFQGYLGDIAVYNGFNFAEDLSWQANPRQPRAINPPGAVKQGQSIDGALTEEMRRGGPFQWPPLKTNYPWEGLQGAIVQAEILNRAGYSAWQWQNQALLRAVKFLYRINWPAEGDDRWQVWLINDAYGTSYPVSLPTSPGKNMAWTDWTHRHFIADEATYLPLVIKKKR